jgi:hypothetical protein
MKWERGIIEPKGKGDAWVTIKITPAIRALLWPSRGTQRKMQVKRNDGSTSPAKRYPFTKDGLRCIRSNIRRLADLPTTSGDRFRLHDLRRDFAINSSGRRGRGARAGITQRPA